jgi:GDPmannose 4,6-dehydratase
MWLMLQHDRPDDFVIATGETFSIRDFLDFSFGHLDLDWQKFIELDARYLRPTEVKLLLGDSAKAREALGWKPTLNCRQLAELMVDSDLELARRESQTMTSATVRG